VPLKPQRLFLSGNFMLAPATPLGTYKFCCRGSGCPSVTVEEKTVTITDDHGGRIQLTHLELQELLKLLLDKRQEATTLDLKK